MSDPIYAIAESMDRVVERAKARLDARENRTQPEPERPLQMDLAIEGIHVGMRFSKLVSNVRLSPARARQLGQELIKAAAILERANAQQGES